MASGASFAGVDLPLATDAGVAMLDADAVLETVDTLRLGWPSSSLASNSMGAQPRKPRPRIGTLYDPAGTRHAVGRFIGTIDTLNAIRAILDGAAGSGSGSGSGNSGSGVGDYVYQSLRMEIDDVAIERTMRLLPPKPLAGSGGTSSYYLLTFVDSRYDAAQLQAPVDGPYTAWQDYLTDLSDTRLVYSGDDAIDDPVKALADAAFRPAKPLWSGCRWPPAVEAACIALGCRFANGTGLVDSAWVTARVAENVAEFTRFAGGRYSWSDWDGEFDDADKWLLDALPSALQVRFRKKATREWVTFTAPMDGRSAPWTLTATGLVCQCTAADSGSGSGSSSGSGVGNCPTDDTLPTLIADADDIQAWVEGLAVALSAFTQAGFVDAKAPGIFDWQPDGVHDVEFCITEGKAYTRVYRQPFCDGVELVQMSPCDDRTIIELPTCVELVAATDSGSGA